MRRALLVLAAAVAGFGSGLDNLDFGGYLENRTSLMISGDDLISDIANLRLEGYWNYKERAGIETHMLISAALQPLDPFQNIRSGSVMERVVGEIINDYISLLDSSQLAMMDENALYDYVPIFEEYIKLLPYSSFYPRDNLKLDRALLKLYFKRFDLFIGRQMVAWGTGYAFNPTDIWNQKSPLEPNLPKIGINALRMEIPFGALSGLSLVASPGPDMEHSSGGFRLKGNMGGFDLSVCGMRVHSADRELLGLPKKVMAGADMAGQVWDIGVWFEGAVNNPVYSGMEYTDFDSIFVQIDAGADYTFTNGLYIMLEYYYNGLGHHSSRNYNKADLYRMLGGEMQGFGKNYVMMGFRKSLWDDFVFSTFVLENVDDISAMLLPSIEYDFTQNLILNLSGQVGVGGIKDTEYGSVFSSVILSATGYF